MKLAHLRVFHAIVAHRGFSGAARALGVTRSHTSQVLAALEASLGTKLLARTTRRVSPTREGLLLFERTAAALATLASAKTEPPRPNSPKVFWPVVARFVSAHPHTRVRVSSTWRAVDLATEGFDFALRVGNPRDQSLVARRLGALELGLFVSPTYRDRRRIDEDAKLEGLHWIVSRPARIGGSRMRQLASGGVLDLPNVTPADARAQCESFGLARAIGCGHGGVGALPTFAVADDVRAGRLVRLQAQRCLSLPAFLVWPSGQKLSRRAAAFRDLALA
jgi:DNA-binding transcriptional LysR family regulator